MVLMVINPIYIFQKVKLFLFSLPLYVSGNTNTSMVKRELLEI